MKKTYLTPTVVVVKIAIRERMLGTISNNRGIGYGGVDTEGTENPSSRKYNWFDDDYDDEQNDLDKGGCAKLYGTSTF